MCSSQRPEAGADSEVEKPYRVQVEDHDGGRVWLTVRAIGPRGALVTARQVALDRGIDIATALRAEEAA